MGTLMCPLCCNQKFSSQSSLRCHLLSIADNIFCPECYERFDSIRELVNHLDGTCAKSSVSALLQKDQEMPSKKRKLSKGTNFIREEKKKDSPEIIHEIKTSEMVTSPNFEHDAKGELPLELLFGSDLQTSNVQCKELVNNPVSIENKDFKDLVEVLKKDFRGNEEINVTEKNENITLTNEAEEFQTMEVVPQEGSCLNCGVTFTNILEHLQMYHSGEEVLVLGEGNDASSGEAVANTATIPTDNGNNTELQVSSTLQQEEDFQAVQNLLMEKKQIVVKEEKGKAVRRPKRTFKPVLNTELKCISREVKIEKFWEKMNVNINKQNIKRTSMRKSIVDGIKRDVRDNTLKIETKRTLKKLFDDTYILKGPDDVFSADKGMNMLGEVKYIIDTTQDQGVENTISVYTCSKCHKEFSNMGAFRKHPCSRASICTLCNGEFKDMQLHMKNVHSLKVNPARSAKCETCNALFASVKALEQHKKEHQPMSCSECNTMCSSKRALDRHMLNHHYSEPEIILRKDNDRTHIKIVNGNINVQSVLQDISVQPRSDNILPISMILPGKQEKEKLSETF